MENEELIERLEEEATAGVSHLISANEAKLFVELLRGKEPKNNLLNCRNCNGFYGININHKCFKCLQSLI